MNDITDTVSESKNKPHGPGVGGGGARSLSIVSFLHLVSVIFLVPTIRALGTSYGIICFTYCDLWKITELTPNVTLVSQDIPKFAVTASFFRTLRYVSVVVIQSYFTRWCVIFLLLLQKDILLDDVFFVLD